MENISTNPQNLLTTKEAAAFVGLSESTIKRAAKLGTLTVYHLGTNGRTNFYDRDDLSEVFSRVTVEQPVGSEDSLSEFLNHPLNPEQMERLAALLA